MDQERVMGGGETMLSPRLLKEESERELVLAGLLEFISMGLTMLSFAG